LRAAAVQAAVDIGAHRLEPGEVLERAGATPDELTRHAGSVDALLAAAYEDIQREVFALAERAFRQPLPPAMRMARALTDVVEYFAAHPDEARFRLIEARRGGPRLAACHDAAMRAYVELMMRRLHDDGSPLRYELITGALSRMLAERVEAGEVEKLPESVPDGLEAASVFAPTLSAAR
jgi:AcrR family transcriptional regulator